MKVALLRPERSEGLPFFCVAWRRGNLRSCFSGTSCLCFGSFEMKLGRIGPWPYTEGMICSFFDLAIRGLSLFSNLHPEFAVLGV